MNKHTRSFLKSGMTELREIVKEVLHDEGITRKAMPAEEVDPATTTAWQDVSRHITEVKINHMRLFKYFTTRLGELDEERKFIKEQLLILNDQIRGANSIKVD
jgi:hypothetical protein